MVQLHRPAEGEGERRVNRNGGVVSFQESEEGPVEVRELEKKQQQLLVRRLTADLWSFMYRFMLMFGLSELDSFTLHSLFTSCVVSWPCCDSGLQMIFPQQALPFASRVA